jgi:hypothetical protein
VSYLILVDGHQVVGGNGDEGDVGRLGLQDGVVNRLRLFLATLLEKFISSIKQNKMACRQTVSI